jgi:hypothetical protein
MELSVGVIDDGVIDVYVLGYLSRSTETPETMS